VGPLVSSKVRVGREISATALGAADVGPLAGVDAEVGTESRVGDEGFVAVLDGAGEGPDAVVGAAAGSNRIKIREGTGEMHRQEEIVTHGSVCLCLCVCVCKEFTRSNKPCNHSYLFRPHQIAPN
jgi:hypothetical protein